MQRRVTKAQELLNGSSVEFTQSGNGVVLKVPVATKGEVDRVIMLKVDQ
jgi:hypothetical protein